MKTFALIGAAGFVAPRHLKAIQATGSTLVAAMDRFDSVGILDHYFPDAHFFTEFERFDRHLEKERRGGRGIDYLTVCTPNYLHDAHVRFGLRQGADVICEKPLVLNPWNISPLQDLSRETGAEVYNLLQLRLHPAICGIRERAVRFSGDRKAEIDLAYITPRGRWYHNSWKGDESKSGGIATNIGIHFFDMLIWIFGSVQQSVVHTHEASRAAGFLELERARVRWFLSIDSEDMPVGYGQARAYRQMEIDGEPVTFTSGFEDLHSKSYEEILAGRGFRMEEAIPSIELVHDIRTQRPVGLKAEYHPMAK